MAWSSIQLALINCTTIENLTRKTAIWHLAVRLPEAYQPLPDGSARVGNGPTNFRTVTYPLLHPTPSRSVPAPTTFVSRSPNDVASEVIAPAPRTFIILQSRPGDNPFDLGPLENIKQIMGKHWWDFLLPLKYSPCCNHESQESAYALGPVVERMKKEAAIFPGSQRSGTTQSSQRRKSRRISASQRDRSRRSLTYASHGESRLRRERKRSRSHRKESTRAM